MWTFLENPLESVYFSTGKLLIQTQNGFLLLYEILHSIWLPPADPVSRHKNWDGPLAGFFLTSSIIGGVCSVGGALRNGSTRKQSFQAVPLIQQRFPTSDLHTIFHPGDLRKGFGIP
jgi:hypothetical protein